MNDVDPFCFYHYHTCLRFNLFRFHVRIREERLPSVTVSVKGAEASQQPACGDLPESTG